MLYKLDNVDWCIYTHYLWDEVWIKQDCYITMKSRVANRVTQLGETTWVVALRHPQDVFIQCTAKTSH